MPLPLILPVAAAAGALLRGAVTQKKKVKQIAVSKYTKKTGKKVKAHIRKAK